MNLETITLVNFLSIGNVTQTVKLNRNILTLILGDNKDLTEAGGRNGVGKCVTNDTNITIRNKQTGLIETLTIGEFHERIKQRKNIKDIEE